MKSLGTLLVLAASVLANVDYLSTDSHFSYTPANQWTPTSLPGSSGCGSETLQTRISAVATFKFPAASTIMQLWGYQQNTEGAATICVDGQSCQTINYFNTSITGTEPPALLLSLTGLSNAVHTVTITNSNATEYHVYGILSIDRITLAGTAPPVLTVPPPFPANTFITNTPLYLPWTAGMYLGGHPPIMLILLDSGASGAWANWVGCTEATCSGHRQYTPSATFYNYTIEDDLYYGGGSEFRVHRVNDTVAFGNVTTVTTFGAAFDMPSNVGPDGNFGVAKSLFVAGACVLYPNFVEVAFVNGQINAAVLSFFVVLSTDSAASGVTSVAQIGGIDRNKYTGTIDWVPMNQQSMWQSPSQSRSIVASSSSSPVFPAWSHQVITFDTGDPGLLGLPTNDWNLLVAAVGGKQDKSSTWWFPCDSYMNLNLKGSTGRMYNVPLSDTTQENVCGLCPALANDSGSTTNWIMGTPFLGQYYHIFHFQANLMGLANKNLQSTAATSAVVVGQA